MQRRLVSLVEASINTLFGFVLSVGVGVVLYPVYGVTFSIIELSGITAVFTIISIGRSYFVRRTFNWFHVRRQERWNL